MIKKRKVYIWLNICNSNRGNIMTKSNVTDFLKRHPRGGSSEPAETSRAWKRSETGRQACQAAERGAW